MRTSGFFHTTNDLQQNLWLSQGWHGQIKSFAGWVNKTNPVTAITITITTINQHVFYEFWLLRMYSWLSLQDGAPKIAKLVYKWLNSIVYGRYNELVNGDYFMVYKPTYNRRAPSCIPIDQGKPTIFSMDNTTVATPCHDLSIPRPLACWRLPLWRPSPPSLDGLSMDFRWREKVYRMVPPSCVCWFKTPSKYIFIYKIICVSYTIVIT